MQTIIQVKLLPTKQHENQIKSTLSYYVFATNATVKSFVDVDETLKTSTSLRFW